MEIKRLGLMNNSLGLIGACIAMSCGIECGYIVDDHITVLKRSDGTFGFKDHKTGKEPPKKIQEKIIKEINEVGK